MILDFCIICGLFSYHETFLKAEESCNKVGGYLADVQDAAENDFIKGVLNVINPKVNQLKLAGSNIYTRMVLITGSAVSMLIEIRDFSGCQVQK